MTKDLDEPDETPELGADALSNLAMSLQPLLEHVQSQQAVIRAGLQRFGEVLAQQVEASGLGKLLERWDETIKTQWVAILKTFASVIERIYPENLREAAPLLKQIVPLLLDEGIPLMWVPGPEVVRALLDAPDGKSRRRIIGRRWERIVDDCESVLISVDHPVLRETRGFALDCVGALRAGYTNPAQALAANLLDSVLRTYIDEAVRRRVTSNKKGQARFDLDAYEVRAALTFAPVWHAHAEYWPKNGDPIPRVFGRHPSAHGVSRNQYSRINAVYAVMLVTSVIKFFDLELEQ